MFSNIAEVSEFAQRIFGPHSQVCYLAAQDGRVLGMLAGEEEELEAMQGTADYAIGAKLLYAIEMAMINGTASANWLANTGQPVRVTLIKCDLADQEAVVCVSIQTVEKQLSGWVEEDLLEEAGIVAFRLETQSNTLHTSNSFSNSGILAGKVHWDDANIFDHLDFENASLRQDIRKAAANAQPFFAPSIYSKAIKEFLEVKAWPEYANNKAVVLTGYLKITDRNEVMHRALKAQGPRLTFTTNPYGRRMVLEYQSTQTPLYQKIIKAWQHKLGAESAEMELHCKTAMAKGQANTLMRWSDIGLKMQLAIRLETHIETDHLDGKRLFHTVGPAGEAWLPKAAPANKMEGLGDGTRATQKAPASSAVGENDTRLLKESHHRIKNSLSLVASLLQLQAMELGDDAAREALTQSVERVRVLADLHTALYAHEQGEEMAVDSKPFIEAVLERLEQSVGWEGITFKNKIEAHQLPAGKMSTIGMLVNEIVMNSLKYAFEKQGKGIIAVSFYKIKNIFYLSVEDNGIGLKKKDKKAKSSESLGMTLIREFCTQLDATLHIEDQVGTRYIITFGAKG